MILFLLILAGGSLASTGFFSGQVFLNLPIDNAFLLVVAIGMTFVIQAFQIPAFIVTLAGMFLARGLGYRVSIDSIPIGRAQLSAWSQVRIPLGPLGQTRPAWWSR